MTHLTIRTKIKSTHKNKSGLYLPILGYLLFEASLIYNKGGIPMWGYSE